MVNRRLNVLQDAGRRQRLDSGLQTNALAKVGFGIAQLDTRLNTVKSGWRNRQVARCGIAVCDRADVRIDAENFLQHHHRALGLAGRCGQVGRQLETIGSGKFNERAHVESLLKKRKRI